MTLLTPSVDLHQRVTELRLGGVTRLVNSDWWGVNPCRLAPKSGQPTPAPSCFLQRWSPLSPDQVRSCVSDVHPAPRYLVQRHMRREDAVAHTDEPQGYSLATTNMIGSRTLVPVPWGPTVQYPLGNPRTRNFLQCGSGLGRHSGASPLVRHLSQGAGAAKTQPALALVPQTLCELASHAAGTKSRL